MTSLDIKLLSKLLKQESESSEDDDLPPSAKMGPGEVKEKVKMRVRVTEGEERERGPADPNQIWDPEDVAPPTWGDDHLTDPRTRPHHHIAYQQAVEPADVFLQMSNKSALTSSCETMVIRVELTGETRDAIDCNLNKDVLDIRSPSYRLRLALPHPVIPEKSLATWYPDTQTLTLNAPISREYDAINF